MPTITISLYCAKCNSYLGAQDFTPEDTDNLDVDPCETCIEAAEHESYEDGRDDGLREGANNVTC